MQTAKSKLEREQLFQVRGTSKAKNSKNQYNVVTVSSKVEGVTWLLPGKLYPVGVEAYERYVDVKLRVTGKATKTALPPNVIHAGIIFHGHVYEYCTDGLRKTKATTQGDSVSVCFVNKMLKRETLGKSDKSKVEFEHWVGKQREGQFSKEKYCVATNQCIHFAVAATEFLEVPHPEEWDDMCRLTENNPKMLKLANCCIRSSATTSASSSASSSTGKQEEDRDSN